MRAVRLICIAVLWHGHGAGIEGVRCLAASATRNNPDYLLTLWQSEDGLPQNYVISLAQTRDGYLWIGTCGGAWRGLTGCAPMSSEVARLVVESFRQMATAQAHLRQAACPLQDGSRTEVS